MAPDFWKHVYRGSLVLLHKAPVQLSLHLEAWYLPLCPLPIHKEFSIMEGGHPERPEGEQSPPDKLQKWLSLINRHPHIPMSFSFHPQGPHLCGYCLPKLCW